MKNRAEQAVMNFEKGFNCSQAAFSVFAEDFGLDEKIAQKIASGFGGGIARGGDICGVVTGGIMALGLKFFTTEGDIQQSKINIYEIVREFKKRFEKQHGSIICRELLGCDISTDEGFRQSQEKDLHNKICKGLVRDTVELLEEMTIQAKK
jgi:C_GCAxxG_C_C family probable redox protein